MFFYVKRVWRIPVGLACITMLAFYAVPGEADTLLHQWDINDGSGSTISAQIGSVTGTLHGSTAWATGGPPSPQSPDYCIETLREADGGVIFTGIDEPDEITVSFWAKNKSLVESDYVNTTMMSKYSYDSGIIQGAYEIGWASSNGRLFAAVWDSNGKRYSTGADLSNPFAISDFLDDEWHQIALNFADRTASLFVDGTLHGSAFIGESRQKQPDVPFCLGRRSYDTTTNPYPAFPGYIGGAVEIYEVTTQSDPSVVIYQETFPINGMVEGAEPLDGWTVRGEQTDADAVVTSPGGPLYDSRVVNNYYISSLSGSTPNSELVVYASEFPIERSLWDVTSFEWSMRNTYRNLAEGDVACRVAIKIGGQWYVSDEEFLYQGDGSNWEREKLDFSTSGSAWKRLTFDTCDEPKPGDTNSDGKVNQDDAANLAANWLESGKSWKDGDFNNDGKVDDMDATLMAANWNDESGSDIEVLDYLSSDLPSGDITSFGLYFLNEPGCEIPPTDRLSQIRLDDITVRGIELTATSVPEPHSAVLFLVMCIGAFVAWIRGRTR